MRTVLVIRHARSTANETEVPAAMTAEDLAFANRTAGLAKGAIKQCHDLAIALPRDHGIVPQRTRVAISEFERTKLTAKLLGFPEGLTEPYPELNEVDHGMDIEILRAMLRRNQIPAVALRAAEKTLRNPPREGVWITHGLLTAGLCIILGIAGEYERPVPDQCEVRRLTF